MKSWHKNSYRMLVIPLANTVWAMIVPWPFAPSVKFDRIPKQWNWQSSRFVAPRTARVWKMPRVAPAMDIPGNADRNGSEWIGWNPCGAASLILNTVHIRFREVLRFPTSIFLMKMDWILAWAIFDEWGKLSHPPIVGQLMSSWFIGGVTIQNWHGVFPCFFGVSVANGFWLKLCVSLHGSGDGRGRLVGIDTL